MATEEKESTTIKAEQKGLDFCLHTQTHRKMFSYHLFKIISTLQVTWFSFGSETEASVSLHNKRDFN